MSFLDVPSQIYIRAAAVFAVLLLLGFAMGLFRINDPKNKESCCDLISEKRRMINLALVFPVVGCLSVFAYVIYAAFVTYATKQDSDTAAASV